MPLKPEGNAHMDALFSQRFGGIGRLFGRDGLQRLSQAHVCVVGVGGVGSWTVEALVRSGVGELTLIDLDDVCITNTNRQLPALEGTFGRPKITVLSERMRAISPGCAVHAVAEFLTPDNAERLLQPDYSVVIDCVDRMAIKARLIARCVAKKTPVITVGGAGGRRDATRVRVADLGRSSGDRLLRQVRKKLRSDYDFPRNPKKKFCVPCVFSDEPQVFPWADGTCRTTAEPGENLKMDCASGYGAATFVTGAFGFAAAGAAVQMIASL